MADRGDEGDKVIRVLGEPLVIPIVLLVDELERNEEKTIQSVLTDRLGQRVSLLKTLERLETIDVIQKTITKDPQIKISYNLTEKGKKMAIIFREAKLIADS